MRRKKTIFEKALEEKKKYDIKSRGIITYQFEKPKSKPDLSLQSKKYYMAQTVYNIYEATNGSQTDNLVKTSSPLTLTTLLSEALEYSNEMDAIAVATYLNSLNNGHTYIAVGGDRPKKPPVNP